MRPGSPRQRSVELLQFERVEPLAQHRLQRVLPPALDVELLPQPPRLTKLARCKPIIRILVAPDFRL
jgi:hypothetical protein